MVGSDDNQGCVLNEDHFRRRRCYSRIRIMAVMSASIMLLPCIFVTNSTARDDSEVTESVEREFDVREALPIEGWDDFDDFIEERPESREWLTGSVTNAPPEDKGTSSILPLFGAGLMYTETDDAHNYLTRKGLYVFSKVNPLVFSLISPFKNTLICNGSLAPGFAAPFEIEIDAIEARLDQYKVTASIVSNSTIAAEVHLTVSFSQESVPKFSMNIAAGDDFAASDFWIEWSIEAVSPILETEDSIIDLGTCDGIKQEYTVPEESRLDIDAYAEDGTFIHNLIVDWTDSNPESLKVGELDATTLLAPRPGLTLSYPRGMLSVDPMVYIGDMQILDSTTGMRNVFFCDEKYFVFFVMWNGSVHTIQYMSSCDGWDWQGPYDTNLAPSFEHGNAFDVAVQGDTVLLSTIMEYSAEYDKLVLTEYSVEGGQLELNAQRTITTLWEGYVFNPHIGSCAITKDGRIWASLCYNDNLASGPWNAVIYMLEDMATGDIHIQAWQGSASNIDADCLIVPGEDSRLTVIITENIAGGGPVQKVKWAHCLPDPYGYESPPWKWYPTSSTLYEHSAGIDYTAEVSAVAVEEDVHIVFTSDDGIDYARIAGSQFDLVQTIGDAGCEYPALSSDQFDSLHLYFATGSDIAYSHSELPGLHSEKEFAAPVVINELNGPILNVLSSAEAFSFSMATIIYLDLHVQDYALWFSSCPVQAHIDRYGGSSDPWNRIGFSDSQPFVQEMGGAVSPGSGLFSWREVDLSASGRSGFDLALARICKTPQAWLGNDPFYHERGPYAISEEWAFDFPYICEPYVHYWMGQEFIIEWDGDRYENRNGEYFELLHIDTPEATYRMYDESGTLYDFDEDGRLKCIVQCNGYNSIDFAYIDVNGETKLDRITDSIGREAVFSYDTYNHTLKAIDYIGRHIDYLVSSEIDKLLSVTNELSQSTTYDYAGVSGPIAKVTNRLGGSVQIEYEWVLLGSGIVKPVATSLKVYDSTYRERGMYFDYYTSNGVPVTTEIHYYGSSDDEFKGRVTYDFNSDSGKSVTSIVGAQLQPMKRIETWYSANDEIQCQDVYSGYSSVPSSYIGVCDEWGNLIYSKDPSGHERFYTYLCTSSQNSYESPGTLELWQDGKIYFDDFSSRTYGDWDCLPDIGTYEIDQTAFPEKVPSFRLTSNPGGYRASAKLMFSEEMQTSSMFIASIATSGASDYPLLELNPPPGYGWGIYLHYDQNGHLSISDYVDRDPGNLQYKDLGAAATNSMVDLCIIVDNLISCSYSVYIDGNHKYSGLQYDSDVPLYKCEIHAPEDGASWIDDVGVFESYLVQVDNLPDGSRVLVEDLHGRKSVIEREPGYTHVNVNIATLHNLLPSLKTAVLDSSFSPIGSSIRRGVWGGDFYSLVPKWTESPFTKTRDGFCNWDIVEGNAPFVDDSPWPGDYVNEISYPMWGTRWVPDPAIASSGLHVHSSLPISGAQYHGFDSATPVCSVGPSDYIIQYVHLPNYFAPDQVLLALRSSNDEDIARMYWGEDIIEFDDPPSLYAFQADSEVPEKGGRWIALCAKATDIGILSSTDVFGMKYASHGGWLNWDATAIGEDVVVKVRLEELEVGQKVELRIKESGVCITDTAVYAPNGKHYVEFNLYEEAGIRAFPVTVSFDVFDGGITSQIVECSSSWFTAYGGDVYDYGYTLFDQCQNPNAWTTHNRLIGTLEFQDGRPDSMEIRTTTCYNAERQPVSVHALHEGDWVMIAQYAYDEGDTGNLETYTDSVGTVTTFTYDDIAQAYIKEITQDCDPHVYTTIYNYDIATSQLESLVLPGPGSRTYDYTYDELGRIETVSYPEVDGQRETRNYDHGVAAPSGEKIYISRDGIYGELELTYDGLGRLTRVFLNCESTLDGEYCRKFVYGWNNLVANDEFYRGVKTNYEYDFLGRRTRQMDVDEFNTYSQIIYDDTHRTYRVIDQCEHMEEYVFDVSNRLTSVREYHGNDSGLYNETTYAYDESGNLIELLNANGEPTYASYDELGYIVLVDYADGTSRETVYHPDGSIDCEYGRDGKFDNYEYDDVHRLVQINYQSDSVALQRGFSYDSWGRLDHGRSTTDGVNHVMTDYTFDARDRITSEETSYYIGDFVDSVQVEYEYDKYGRMINLLYPNGELVEYSYTSADAIESIDGYLIGSYYQPFYGTACIMALDYSNGVVQEWDRGFFTQYDNLVKSFEVWTQDFDRTVSYDYYPNRNIMAEDDKVFLYDGQGRLKGIVGGGSFEASYSFDETGNIETKDDFTGSLSYDYDLCNRIDTFSPGTRTYDIDYNPEGSVTLEEISTRTRWLYDYDGAERLAKIDLQGRQIMTIAEYWHDAFDRRVLSLEGNTWTMTAYSGASPVYQEVLSKPNPHQECYIYGPQDHLIAVNSDGVKYWYHQNLRGDVIMVTDAGGHVVWNADYGPYGEYVANITTYTPTHRFVGEMFDEETDLYNFGFRDYSPKHGRFLSEDPIASDVNQYTYCRGDPANMVDRHGLWFESLFDIGCLLWSIDEYRNDPSWENFGWVLADVGALALPIVPAFSGIVRAGKMVDKAMDAGRAVDVGRNADWAGRVLKTDSDWGALEKAFGKLPPYVRKSFDKGVATVDVLIPGKRLARFGPVGGGFYADTHVMAYSALKASDKLALPMETVMKGGRLYTVKAPTLALHGKVGKNFGKFGGDMQYYIMQPQRVNLEVVGNSFWMPL